MAFQSFNKTNYLKLRIFCSAVLKLKNCYGKPCKKKIIEILNKNQFFIIFIKSALFWLLFELFTSLMTLENNEISISFINEC